MLDACSMKGYKRGHKTADMNQGIALASEFDVFVAHNTVDHKKVRTSLGMSLHMSLV